MDFVRGFAEAGYVFLLGVGLMLGPLAVGKAPLGWMGMWWALVALYVAALDLREARGSGLSWRVVVSSVAVACAWPVVVLPWREWFSAPGRHAQRYA